MKKCIENRQLGQNAAALPRIWRNGKGARIILILLLIALIVSLIAVHFETKNDLKKSCESVTEDFTSIMKSYRHSFCLFEKLLQREIFHAKNADEIEAFLKEQDAPLLAIEGEDYDGVYMYYQGRYLYSWGTPYAVYRDSGYDATKRPWYVGAVAAKGELFFSVPYPSYANDYMLATISRLQPDGETVIAYDIKLGQIEKYVDRLDLYSGALTLICDQEGNIIGSTEHLYQGGNYTLSQEEQKERVELAQTEFDQAVDANVKDKAALKIRSAEAQLAFNNKQQEHLMNLLDQKGTIQYQLKDFSFGYASSNDSYTCFVLSPIGKLGAKVITLWAALSFFFVAGFLLIGRLIGRSSQILMDGLTGLNNRRALLRYCDKHILHRPEEDLSLIMLDLNEFKKINDEFGHVTGDHALQDTADALKKTCVMAPCSFFLCRYGGDEFLLAGENCSREEIDKTTALIVESLKEKNESSRNPYVLEAGIGVACGKCTDRSSLEKLLEMADRDMYNEKMKMKKASARQ